jgi:hypothetical protein
MAVPTEWIEHRRGDSELLGWMRPEGDGFVAIDRLGRPITGLVEWMEGEEVLEALGIGYLADPYELRSGEGGWLRVRILEVSGELIRVKKEDGGAIDAPREEYTLPFPLPPELRPYRPEGSTDQSSAFPFGE